MKFLSWSRRLLVTAIILALIATNVLTLTSTAFNAAVSGLEMAAVDGGVMGDVCDPDWPSQSGAEIL